MIICGYAGIGKSTLSKRYPAVMDLESTPFEKDWERYAKCAIHYHKQGYLVLISCHKEIREEILSMLGDDNAGVYTIVPNINDKEEYRKRYTNRGNTPEFIKMQMDNWERWLSPDNAIEGEDWVEMNEGDTLPKTLFDLIGFYIPDSVGSIASEGMNWNKFVR
mgnify:CR=1 FL=1